MYVHVYVGVCMCMCMCMLFMQGRDGIESMYTRRVDGAYLMLG